MRHALPLLVALLPSWVAVVAAEKPVAASVIVVRPGESLARAVERARSVPRPRIIELAAGRHELAEALRLGPEDSGLTLRGPAAGATRVVGSRRVTDWKLVDRARSVWEAPLPARWGDRPVTHVFWNGRGLQVARTPNTGWLETVEKLGQGPPFEMTVPGDALRPDWAKRGDVYVVCLQKWAGFRLPIRAVDLKRKRVTLPAGPPPHRQEARNRFWVENAPEALDSPGEWYADRAARALRLIPPRGGKVEAADVTAASLPALLRLEGCKGVTVQGLTFAECGDDFPVEKGEIDSQAASARRGAIQLRGCRDCVIERCVVTEVGGYAVDLGRGSRDCSVRRCELHELGAGGVRIGETVADPKPGAQVHGHTVADCRVHHYGRHYPGAVGLMVLQASGNRLLHNDVHDAPYTGISVGWTWGYRASPCRDNLIEGNHIHHLGGKLLSDLGGVYLLGPQPGTVVRRNWVHDLRCFEYGAWGLYTDEGSTGVTLERNVVVRCEKAGFHQHYGRDNVVRGNLFAHCGEGAVRLTRAEGHLSFRFSGNVVLSDTPRLLHGPFQKGRCAFERNLYFCPTPDKATWGGLDWARWRAKGQDRGSLVLDPLLVDPARPERGFRPGSPAKRIGFEMPDVRTIGVRPHK